MYSLLFSNLFAVIITSASTNTAATAYSVKLNESNLSGNSDKAGSAGKALKDNSTKYVKLDLSGSTFPNAPGSSFPTIGDSAFEGCTSLTSVTIPSSVKIIADYAFKGCSSLTSVTIPNGISSIDDGVFYNCSGLTSITLPNSIEGIGQDAFYGCDSLTSVTFQGKIAKADFSGLAFTGDLHAKFYATDATNGTPGTYTTTAPVGSSSKWTKK